MLPAVTHQNKHACKYIRNIKWRVIHLYTFKCRNVLLYALKNILSELYQTYFHSLLRLLELSSICYKMSQTIKRQKLFTKCQIRGFVSTYNSTPKTRVVTVMSVLFYRTWKRNQWIKFKANQYNINPIQKFHEWTICLK